MVWKCLEAQLATLWWSEEAAEVMDFPSQTQRIPSRILLFPLYEKVIPKKLQRAICSKAFVKRCLSSFVIRNSGCSFPVYSSEVVPWSNPEKSGFSPRKLSSPPKTNQDCKRNRQITLENDSRHCLFSCEQWYTVNPGAYFQPCIFASWSYKGAQKVRETQC